MPRLSAGLVMYRLRDNRPEFLLVHPGGPFFSNKYDGHWTIPKGEPDEGEPLLAAARREFIEETGLHLPAADAPLIALAPITQKGGKIVHAWAFEGDCNPAEVRSNTFTIEWPPRSGKSVAYPEVDAADFFDLPAAKQKIKPTQFPLLEELAAKLGAL
jgi:predicted NUDIX family NTP pyrophosphohydrolase